MANLDMEKVQEKPELHGKLAEFRTALEEEIAHCEKNGLSSIILTNGSRVEGNQSGFYYRFFVEYAPNIPDDTPCNLIIGKDRYEVTVIRFDGTALTLSAKNPLPDTLGKVRLENGSTVLMERLISCIEENANKKNPVGERMLPFDEEKPVVKRIADTRNLILDNHNTPNQTAAICSALTNDLTYIWGPPGTGKTAVIGQIIGNLFAQNRTVLVVSHTNTAVNGAVKKALDKEKNPAHVVPKNNTDCCPILRLGNGEGVPNEATIEAHVAFRGKELQLRKEEFTKAKEAIQKRLRELSFILNKNKWIQEVDLSLIKSLIEERKRLQQQLGSIIQERKRLEAELQKEKTSRPDYIHYEKLKAERKDKADGLLSFEQQLAAWEKALQQLPLDMDEAKDEIRKHDKYAALKEKESQYMSESFLRNELNSISAKKNHLETEIRTLSNELATAHKTITDYEQKGALAKFFSGKNAVLDAQKRIPEIEGRLSTLRDDLQRQDRLEQETRTQLQELLYLQEQIKTVTPSATKGYWDKKRVDLQNQLEDIKKRLPTLRERISTIRSKIEQLDILIPNAEKAFTAVHALEVKLHAQCNAVSIQETRIAEYGPVISQAFQKEIAACATFGIYLSDESGESALLYNLELRLNTVRQELSDISIPAIVSEREEQENALVETIRLLAEIADKMSELEREAILSAPIIGATLAKSYLDKTLRLRTFDTVILDEASMASIPALWCAAYLAEKNIVIVGDFLQLPPIVMANSEMAEKWLGTDIFYHNEFNKREGQNVPYFCALNDQFRMESEIADVANIYYGEFGGLQSRDYEPFRVDMRDSFYEWYSGNRTEHCIHLIDTESLNAWVTGVPQGKGHSRLNMVSAAVSVNLAFKFLEKKLEDAKAGKLEPQKEPSVLIVAPYKPHIKHIERLLEVEYANRGLKNLDLIRAGTIHSFQGSEADIVIFDLVIDEPHWKANLFINSPEANESLKKMFNVAITRARFKLFVVGDFDYCQRRAKDNAFAEFLHKLVDEKHLVKEDAQKLLPKLVSVQAKSVIENDMPAGKHIICRSDEFDKFFKADLAAFQHQMIIYSPFMTETRLSTLQTYFTDAVNAGKEIIVVTKALSDRGKREAASYQQCENFLRKLGVKIIHKKGMHEKLVFIDDTAYWNGSLNALSFSGVTGEIMERYEDTKSVKVLKENMGVGYILNAIEKEEEQKCPVCGGEMQAKESDKGGIYWECENKDFSRAATQQHPTDGLIRCKECNVPYIFVMKNQPRWVCPNNPRHYQAMREGDLKLEKMAALIPTKKARKEVDRYFADKKKKSL